MTGTTVATIVAEQRRIPGHELARVRHGIRAGISDSVGLAENAHDIDGRKARAVEQSTKAPEPLVVSRCELREQEDEGIGTCHRCERVVVECKEVLSGRADARCQGIEPRGIDERQTLEQAIRQPYVDMMDVGVRTPEIPRHTAVAVERYRPGHARAWSDLDAFTRCVSKPGDDLGALTDVDRRHSASEQSVDQRRFACLQTAGDGNDQRVADGPTDALDARSKSRRVHASRQSVAESSDLSRQRHRSPR